MTAQAGCMECWNMDIDASHFINYKSWYDKRGVNKQNYNDFATYFMKIHSCLESNERIICAIEFSREYLF